MQLRFASRIIPHAEVKASPSIPHDPRLYVKAKANLAAEMLRGASLLIQGQRKDRVAVEETGHPNSLQVIKNTEARFPGAEMDFAAVQQWLRRFYYTRMSLCP